MNEDYLWDKSGDDPEIENLEKTLSVFRYTETEAPATQLAQPVAVVGPGLRWKFAFAYAFAALTVAAILAGVWIRTSSGPDTTEKSLASIVQPQVKSETEDRLNVSTDPVIPIDRLPGAARERKPLRSGSKRFVAHSDRQASTTPVKSRDRRGTAALTEEEKYAYGQLMLALSITGSKLKIVKDTINGIEDREDAAKQNER